MALDTSTAPATMSFVEATNLALDWAMKEDPSVLVLGEDVGDAQGGGVAHVTKGLSSRYGDDRVLSTPISEQAIVGAAIGAAIAGQRPVAEIMLMNFLAVCMDQLVNHAAKLRYMSGGKTPVPLTIRTTTGAGLCFGAQHSDMLEAWLAHTAGVKVAVPSTPADAHGLLLSCIFDDDPCVFVENTGMYMGGVAGPAPAIGERIPLGKANVLREGSDVTVVGYGRQVHDAAAVAEQLAGEGTSVELIDLRTVAPLDMDTVLASVSKTGRAVVFHEAPTPFGVGAELAARIHHELWGHLDAPVERVGSLHTPVPYAPPLEQTWLMGQPQLRAAIERTLR